MATIQDLNKIKLTPVIDTIYVGKISDQDYFSPTYSDYISNSRLGLINPTQGGSPKKYKEGFKKTGDTSFFDLGSAVHGEILQPEYCRISKTVSKPNGILGGIADACYEHTKKTGEVVNLDIIREKCAVFDYYHGFVPESKLKEISEKIIPYVEDRIAEDLEGYEEGVEYMWLPKKLYDIAYSCINNLNNNDEVTSLLHPVDMFDSQLPSYNETAFLMDLKAEWPDGHTEILKLKAKLDNFTIDKENNKVIINDVKTTSRPLSMFMGAADTYHYYREFAMYAMMLSAACKKLYGMDNPVIEGNYLTVETNTELHESAVFTVTPEKFMQGIKEANILIKLVAHHTRYGF